MITVKDWMSKPVLTIKTGTSVLETAKKMESHNIGCIIISDDGKKPKGIVTERDILRIVSQGGDLAKTKIDEIMTKKVLSADTTTSLLEISKIMSKNSLRRIVITQKDEMVGIVTSSDLLQLMAG